MGILSNLFKTKFSGPKFEGPPVRNPFAAPVDDASGVSDIDEEQPAQKSEPEPQAPQEALPLRSINFGGSKASTISRTNPLAPGPQKKNIHSTAAAGGADVKKTIKKVLAARATTIPDKQIVIHLDDVMSQIPAHLLHPGWHSSARKELRFNTYELLPGLSLGKAEVPLARIAELVPEIFTGPVTGINPEIKLPLHKVVTQIGAFPARPDQMEEQFPPLDAQFAKLIVENGVPVPEIAAEPAPVAVVETVAPAPEPAPKIEAEVANVIPASPAPVEPAATPPVEPPAESPAVAAVVEPELPEAVIEGVIEPLPPPPVIDEKVSYSLAALLPNAPKSWLKGGLKSVDNTARIVVPFHLIESQLSTGRVDLGFEDFFQALPGEYKSHFSGDHEEAKAARIVIPLNEVFQNLPGVEPLPPTPVSAPVEVPKEPETAPAAVETTPPVADTAAPEPVVSETQSAILEEARPAEISAPVVEGRTEQPQPAEPAASAIPEQKIESPAAPEAPAPVTVTTAPGIQPEPAAKAESRLISHEETDMLLAMPASEPAVKPETPVASKEPVAAPPANEEPQAPVAPASPKPPVEPPAPMYPDPTGNPAHVTPSFTLPKIQFQRMAPPTFMPKDVPATAEEKPAEEFESDKILEFTGVTTAFHENAVEDLFTTDGKVDSEKVMVYVSRLPGIQAIVLTVDNATRTGGDIPPNFNLEATGNAASVLFQALQGRPDGPTQNVTLHHDGFSTTWFKQGTILLGTLHAGRALAEGQHDQIALVAEEVARLRTT